MRPSKNQPPDATIARNAIRQLANRGLRAPCHINVQSRNGEVTLSGHVLYPHQRDAALQALRSIEGVSRVTDQLKIKPPVKHEYKTLPPLAKPAQQEEAAEAEPAEAEAPTDAIDKPTAAAAPATQRPAVESTAEENLSDSTDFELGPLPPRRGPTD